MQRFVSAIALCALATTAVAQSSIVIPAGYDTVLEDSANVFPYGTGASAWPGLRIQHVYDSTHFTSQNVTAPVMITGLRWRAADTAATWTGGTYTPATINLSTAAVDYTATTTNYATNHGANVTQVFSGTVTVQAGTGNGIGIIGPWHVDVQFQTPFLYDPAAGDLCIDCDVALPGLGGFTALASCGGAAPIPPLARRVYASSLYPNANGVDSNILVCEVQFSPGAGYAYSSAYGDGCVQQYASFQESYASCDLSNTSLTMQNIGTGYVCLPGTTPLYVPTSAPVAFGDDVVVPFSLGWTLPYPGGTTTDLYVSSNGFVHGAANTNSGCCSFLSTLFLTNGPCWSAKWRDLNPGAGGSVYLDTDPTTGTAYVTFDSVPDYGTTNLNTFQYAFNANGTVELRFGTMAPTTGTTGWSPGANNLLPPSIDISAQAVIITEAADVSPITHNASARPVIGTTFALNTNNVPASSVIGATLFGLTQINPGLDLTSIGMPGCYQYVSIDASQVWLAAGGVGSTNFSIPNVAGLAGVEIKTQGAALVPGINALGALTTNGMKHVIDIN